jgi:hypothetical protein
MSEDHLRIGDAEREQAAAALGEHYAQGRLTAEEHAERLDRVWAARTRAALHPVFRDLPVAPRPEVRRPPYRRGPFPRFLFPVLAILVVLSAITHLPFALVGLLVVLFVVARRRGPHRMQHRMQRWPG